MIAFSIRTALSINLIIWLHLDVGSLPLTITISLVFFQLEAIAVIINRLKRGVYG